MGVTYASESHVAQVEPQEHMRGRHMRGQRMRGQRQ